MIASCPPNDQGAALRPSPTIHSDGESGCHTLGAFGWQYAVGQADRKDLGRADRWIRRRAIGDVV